MSRFFKLVNRASFFIGLSIFSTTWGATARLNFSDVHPSSYRASLMRISPASLLDELGLDSIDIDGTEGILIKTESTKKIPPWQRLVATIEGDSDPEESEDKELSGALIMFPVGDGNSTIVFSLGNAGRKLPRTRKQRGFGRHILAAEDAGVDADGDIKGVRKKTRVDPNPMTASLTRSKPASLSSFGIDPMRDEISDTRAKTGLSDRYSAGGDEFVFRTRTRSMIDRREDLGRLEELATLLYTLFSSDRVSAPLAYLRDDREIEDATLLTALNRILLSEIRRPGNPFVFVEAPDDWCVEDVEYFSVGPRGRSRQGLDLLEMVTLRRVADLEQSVRIKLDGDSHSTSEPLMTILSTSPLYEEGQYFYMRRGTWYFISRDTVDQKRTLVEDTLLDLSAEFIKFDASKHRTDRGEGTIASENDYNVKLYEDLKRQGKEVYLFDCKNLSDGDGGKFEFADLILKEGDQIYIIHVKRGFNGGSVSHLFHQVRSSTEFLVRDPAGIGGSVRDKILEAMIPPLISPELEEKMSTVSDMATPKTLEQLRKQIEDLRVKREDTPTNRRRSARVKETNDATNKSRSDLADDLEEILRILDAKSRELTGIFGTASLDPDQVGNVHMTLAFIDEDGRGFEKMPLSYIDDTLSVKKEVETSGFKFGTIIIDSA